MLEMSKKNHKKHKIDRVWRGDSLAYVWCRTCIWYATGSHNAIVLEEANHRATPAKRKKPSAIIAWLVDRAVNQQARIERLAQSEVPDPPGPVGPGGRDSRYDHPMSRFSELEETLDRLLARQEHFTTRDDKVQALLEAFQKFVAARLRDKPQDEGQSASVAWNQVQGRVVGAPLPRIVDDGLEYVAVQALLRELRILWNGHNGEET